MFLDLHRSFIRNNKNAVVTCCQNKQIDLDSKCFFVAQTLRFLLEILREGVETNLPKWQNILFVSTPSNFSQNLLIGNHYF